jgi:hypothetical protein
VRGRIGFSGMLILAIFDREREMNILDKMALFGMEMEISQKLEKFGWEWIIRLEYKEATVVQSNMISISALHFGYRRYLLHCC